MPDRAFAEAEVWRVVDGAVALLAQWGAAALWAPLRDHERHLAAPGRLEERRAARLARELQDIVAERLHERARALCAGDDYERLHEAVLHRRLDPWAASDQLLG